jgi:hypothetical protein
LFVFRYRCVFLAGTFGRWSSGPGAFPSLNVSFRITCPYIRSISAINCMSVGLVLSSLSIELSNHGATGVIVGLAGLDFGGWAATGNLNLIPHSNYWLL